MEPYTNQFFASTKLMHTKTMPNSTKKNGLFSNIYKDKVTIFAPIYRALETMTLTGKLIGYNNLGVSQLFLLKPERIPE